MTTPRGLLSLVLALLTLSLLSSSSNGKAMQTEGAPKISIAVPANNALRYGIGLTFIAGTVEGTDIKEVGVSIHRVGTNEEWSATKKKGSFVAGPTGKWLKASIDGNNWYVPVSSYYLPTFADLLPEGKDEMRYIIYAYAQDRQGRRSEEGEGSMFIVRR
ncbi:MAG TPA: hypothetical protein VF658_19985 [Pyrinomonadaceae bacterium]